MPKLLVSPVKVMWKTIVLFAGLLSVTLAGADTLKVCSDPDNLPFSKAEGPDKGLYIELAEMVAERLGSSVEYVWWLTHNQRRAIRNTMNECDAYFALPASADYKVKGVEKTHAFLDVGYAIVGPESFKFGALEDLRGRRVGVLHGAMSLLLQDSEGQVQEAHSISAGLDYPGVGPEHSYLKTIGRAEYGAVTDVEALDALQLLCRLEGIIPALETAHAFAWLDKLCPTLAPGTEVVVNLSGRGDKDVNTVADRLGGKLGG